MPTGINVLYFHLTVKCVSIESQIYRMFVLVRLCMSAIFYVMGAGTGLIMPVKLCIAIFAQNRQVHLTKV